MSNKKMIWSVLREGNGKTLPTNNEMIEFMQQIQEPEFDKWSIDELFYHLIDLYLIPYEEEINDWIHYKEYMINLCKESYERSRKTT